MGYIYTSTGRIIYILSWISVAYSGEKVYELISDEVWYSAVGDICRKYNMSVLTLTSPADVAALDEIWSEKRRRNPNHDDTAWLGLNLPLRSADEADFKWTDGTPLSLTWSNWEPLDEPDGLRSSKCVVVKHMEFWHTRPCYREYSVICQGWRQHAQLLDPRPSFGPHFRRIGDMAPSGEALSSVRKSSSVRCAASCLQNDDCGVVYWVQQTRACSLYPADVSLVHSPADGSFGVTYFRDVN